LGATHPPLKPEANGHIVPKEPKLHVLDVIGRPKQQFSRQKVYVMLRVQYAPRELSHKSKDAIIVSPPVSLILQVLQSTMQNAKVRKLGQYRTKDEIYEPTCRKQIQIRDKDKNERLKVNDETREQTCNSKRAYDLRCNERSIDKGRPDLTLYSKRNAHVRGFNF